jgi:DNA-binding beta-propeller fold protein YncE
VLKNPESALYDEQRGVIYVSNVNGDANAKDGNGFISRLSTDGKVLDVQWVTGLNGPKGLGRVGNKLYAADIDTLVEIDIKQSKISHRYEAPGAKFLNDVATDGKGNVYVSDMVTNKIHRLHAGVLKVWLDSPTLENPNGLHVDGDRMIEGAWGVMTGGSFNTPVPGRVKVISMRNKSIKDFGGSQPIGNMDGIELLPDGQVLATDWMKGKLMTVVPDGTVKVLINLHHGTANVGYMSKKQIALLPMMMDNMVIAYQLKSQ